MKNKFIQIANEFLLKQYNVELSIPIIRNNRLRSTMGRYIYEKLNKPLRIELAGFLLDYGEESVVVDVLKHECIHYALHVKGMPSRDGHPYFESELKKHKVSSTNEKLVGKVFVYRCSSCLVENVTKKKRVFQLPHLYRTSCCHASLQFVAEKIFTGV